jgi:hypothetical protein
MQANVNYMIPMQSEVKNLMIIVKLKCTLHACISYTYHGQQNSCIWVLYDCIILLLVVNFALWCSSLYHTHVAAHVAALASPGWHTNSPTMSAWCRRPSGCGKRSRRSLALSCTRESSHTYVCTVIQPHPPLAHAYGRRETGVVTILKSVFAWKRDSQIFMHTLSGQLHCQV